MDSLLEGAALTVLVVFLFLRNWRATVVAGVALVLSILPAFAVMHWLGYTLNSISLLAITLVIGILVDDAIVEIESIEQHLRIGKRPFQAALDASDAIGFAMVAITATIVAVFLPVSFVGGTVGQYFHPVRHHRLRRRAGLAAGRLPRHAALGRLPAAPDAA